MNDDNKTREQLVHELTELRSQNTTLKKSMTGSISAELAAEEARRYAESIVETVREPLLVIDADMKIVSANRNFYTTFKVTPSETIGYLIYDLGNKQWNIPTLRKLLEEVLPERQAFDDFEMTHNFQTIGTKIMLLNACRIYRQDIGSQMILLAIEDITERKRMESLLIESEERYRRVFETASDGIVFFEEHEGKITQANPAAEKMLGYTQKECIGNRLPEIGILLDGGDFPTTMRNLNKSGIINYRNVMVKTKSGQHIDTEVYLVDRAKLVQCNIRDITEHKQAKKKLQESETHYRSLVESMPGIVYSFSHKRGGLYYSSHVMNLLGYTPEELYAQPLLWHDSIHPDDLLRIEQVIREAAMGKPFLIEYRIRDAHGNWHWIDDRSFGCRMDGADAIIEGLALDITDRKRAEESLKEAVENLRRAVNTTIQVMVSAVEIRDPYTSGHQIRAADLACAIAKEMKLSPEKIVAIRMAGSIHDIGKLSIPAEILSKPTKLSEIEFSLIKEHALRGYEVLKNVESPWPLAEIVYQHHERMDGSGYPRKLKGEEICLEARILAVADVVEAMASHRPYRPSLGIDAALEEIKKNSGTLYDQTVAAVCLSLFREKGFKLEKT